MPVFAEAGGGCSGTGPDRAVGRQGFLPLAPWVVVALFVCQPGAGQVLPWLGMLDREKGGG